MLDLNNFPSKVDELVYYLDDVQGKNLFYEISNEERKIIQADPTLFGAYMALQFLIIPFLSTREIANLFKEFLNIGLDIDDIDLVERVKKKLLFLYLNRRDDCKKALKAALVSSNEHITEEVEKNKDVKLRTTSEWIRDYISHRYHQKGEALEEAQYMFQKSYILRMNEKDRNKLKKLFDLYKFLDTSSMTPEGFEDDLLLELEDGKNVTTQEGRVVILHDPNKKKKTIEIPKPKARTVAKPAKTEEEKSLDELEAMAEQFKPGSLERKAIDEEIKRLLKSNKQNTETKA